jgi:hypothetical protein
MEHVFDRDQVGLVDQVETGSTKCALASTVIDLLDHKKALSTNSNFA